MRKKSLTDIEKEGAKQRLDDLVSYFGTFGVKVIVSLECKNCSHTYTSWEHPWWCRVASWDRTRKGN